MTPVPDTVTFPEGADGDPVAWVSVTVTVAVEPCRTRTVAGDSPRADVVIRPATVRLKDCVTDCGVGELESVTLSVKTKEPEPDGVPEIVPPDDSVKPVGNVPDTSVQVTGPCPPTV